MTSDFVLVNGLLFKLLWKRKVTDDPSMVLCVPEEFVPQILYHYHDYIMSGHQGIVRTYLMVREKYFFPHMFKKVQQYVRSCHLCQTTKASAKLPMASFSCILVNFTPFDRMSMDIKDMPMNSSHYHKIVIVNCLATQYTVVCPLRTISTETVFDCLFTKIICVFGKPSVIITDQQSSFTSHLMERLATVFGTQLQFVGKEHHGANPTERYIQSMNNVFKKYLEDTGKNWPSYLPPVCYALNTFVSPSTGFSPYELMFIRKPPCNTLTDFTPSVLEGYTSSDQYMKVLKQKLDVISKIVMNEKAQQQELQRVHAECTCQPIAPIAKGDLVLFKHSEISDLLTSCKKLNHPWVGPVKVQAILAPHKYLVSNFEGQLCPVIFERHELKPYYLRDPASMTTGGAKWALQDAVQQLRAHERSQMEV